MSNLWIPRALRVAPTLDPACVTPPYRPRHALLLNPFYPKDPHASFGKHVLTPSLALTSIAAATPPDWTVQGGVCKPYRHGPWDYGWRYR